MTDFFETLVACDPEPEMAAFQDAIIYGTGAVLCNPDGTRVHVPVSAPAHIPRARTHLPILAIDPGTTQSGWALLDGERVEDSGVMPNAELLASLAKMPDNGQTLAIEMIASYGMAVGREVFETCVWIGRFVQAWHKPDDVKLVYRRDVKLHLCGTAKAKDANIRQAILDLFPRNGGGKTPQVGTKSQPGPLYGVSSHAWAALGVALTAKAQMKQPDALAILAYGVQQEA